MPPPARSPHSERVNSVQLEQYRGAPGYCRGGGGPLPGPLILRGRIVFYLNSTGARRAIVEGGGQTGALPCSNAGLL